MLHAASKMIKKATLQDLLVIKKLTDACAKALQEKDIFQWNENYPSRGKLEQDIKHEELYVLVESGDILGIIVLTPRVDEEYIPVSWLTPNENNLYIHRLAVHPLAWGQGKGQELMNFAEDFARKKGYQSVRLDTFSRNKRNQAFYESRGYVRLENIFFPKQSEHPFFCYEKVLV